MSSRIRIDCIHLIPVCRDASQSDGCAELRLHAWRSEIGRRACHTRSKPLQASTTGSMTNKIQPCHAHGLGVST